jgi:tetratricopeptide (TPR) repeat protein
MTPIVVLVVALSLSLQAAPTGQAPAQPATPVGQAYFLFMQGRGLEADGKVDEAIAAFQQALTIVPKAAEIHAELAGLYARQNKATESLRKDKPRSRSIPPTAKRTGSSDSCRRRSVTDAGSDAVGALLAEAVYTSSTWSRPIAAIRCPSSRWGSYVETENYPKGITTLQLFLL